MAARKRKPVDPLAKKVKKVVARKGYTVLGQPTKAAQKAGDEAVRQRKIDQDARMRTFNADFYDEETNSFPALERMSDPSSLEYDPETYNEILATSGIDADKLYDAGLSSIDTAGASRDIGTSEILGDVEDYEDIENSDLAGSNLLSGALSQILGKEQRGPGGRRSRGRTTTGLEEGGAAARTAPPARAPQAAAPTSSRRTTIPRLKTVKELTDEQRIWAGTTRKGEFERPYVQPQSLTTSDPGRDLGVAAITSTPENREAREQNATRLMVGTFNELVRRENEALGNSTEPSVTPSGRVQRLGDQSMTIPVEGSAPAAQPAQAAAPAVTPPTPGRIIRSSNASGRPMATREGMSGGVPLGDVTGANAATAAPAPAPVPGRPSGPRRTRINRVPSGDVTTGGVNPSGMSTQLQRFLRDNQMAGIIGPGSRSGGAMLKGSDAVTRRVGGEALGTVVGSWEPTRDNPATAVRETDSGAFELVDPLQVRTDPMDPDYVPYANSPKIPIRDISGEEGEKAVREIQAAILRSGKPASFTGRRPSTSKDPLPGPTVMEQTSTEQYGRDVTDLAREHGISAMDAARRLSAADELLRRKNAILKEGTEAVVTSGEELNILRSKPGAVTSVKGQMSKVNKAGGGTENVRTTIPTADELISMFPRKDAEDDDAYANRLSTYLVPKRSVLTPDQIAKRTADFEANKKASRQAGMPKPPSKAQQARDRKLKDKRIAEEQAPRKAYEALREGPNAEDQLDTPGFMLAHSMDPYGFGAERSATKGTGTPTQAMLTGDAERITSKMLGADIEQFELDQRAAGSPSASTRSIITGDLLRPSSDDSFNLRYQVRGPGGAVTANPTGNPYFKNVNDSQFGGYRSQASSLATPIPVSEPKPAALSESQRMENIRRADALVAQRAGGFSRIPLEGESMSDMARRVGSAGGFRQVGRSMKSERKASRKAAFGAQFGESPIGEQP